MAFLDIKLTLGDGKEEEHSLEGVFTAYNEL